MERKLGGAALELPYSVALGMIKDGDLLAWKWRFFSHAIGRELGGWWTHTGIALWVHGRLCVIEAVPPRVRLVPIDRFKHFYWVPTNSAWGPEQSAYAIAQLDDHYSLWDCLIGYGGMPVDDWREQCAELSIRLAHKAGVNLGDRATPGACVRAALAAPGAMLHHIEIPHTHQGANPNPICDTTRSTTTTTRTTSPPCAKLPPS